MNRNILCIWNSNLARLTLRHEQSKTKYRPVKTYWKMALSILYWSYMLLTVARNFCLVDNEKIFWDIGFAFWSWNQKNIRNPKWEKWYWLLRWKTETKELAIHVVARNRNVVRVMEKEERKEESGRLFHFFPALSPSAGVKNSGSRINERYEPYRAPPNKGANWHLLINVQHQLRKPAYIRKPGKIYSFQYAIGTYRLLQLTIN